MNMAPQTILFLFILFLSLEFIFDKVLDFLNAKHFNDPIPEVLKDIYEEEEYKKSQEYKKINFQFNLIESVFSFVLIIGLLVSGFFGKLDQWVMGYSSNEVIQSLFYFIILYLGSLIISLPFSYYHTFVIEEKFGFNKSTKKLFFKDFFKNLIIGIILIIFLGGIIVWIYQKTGKDFWIYALFIFALFSVFINLFYTSLILPLFNKLSPIENGEIKEKISLLAKKTNYNLNKIFIIDGSKRSSKANAFFSGFGPKKKVILYDTLLKELNPNEITAVLAHEIGHYKKKHIIINLFLSLLSTALFLYIFSLLIDNKEIAMALGANRSSFHVGIIAFAILFIPVSFLIGVITNYISRVFEYQADNYAKNNWNAQDLIFALKKLSKQSLGNLTPHPWYVFIHYSHPPLKDRIINLSNKNN